MFVCVCVYFCVYIFPFHICLSGRKVDYLVIRQIVATDFRNRFDIILLGLLLLCRLVNLESLRDESGKGVSDDPGSTNFLQFSIPSISLITGKDS